MSSQSQLHMSDSIERLSGVGQKRSALYKKLSLSTVGELVSFFPRDYLDLTTPVPIAETVVGEMAVIKATVSTKKGEQRIRKGLSIFKLTVCDDSGALTITIFNSIYMFDALKIGKEYIFYGKINGDIIKREMTSPAYYEGEQTAILPIYPLTEGLTNKMVRTNMLDALSQLSQRFTEDRLPDSLRLDEELCHLQFAIQNIHFPQDHQALELARKRLIFEELLIFQLGLLLIKNKNSAVSGNQLKDIAIDEFYSALPFTLTDGQNEAILSSLHDMQKKTPMNRLVQGDVGSGKTMVGAALCYACFKNSLQAAFMAPTQILADQHYTTLKNLLEPLGVSVLLLAGGQTPKQRNEILSRIESGKCDIVVGTHALVQDKVKFNSLALVITDEQHRFGVSQRASLANKGDNPHLLVMSATPIPRTLALIIYGELDVSIIKELPKGRQPIDTLVISSKKRLRALSFIKNEIDNGRQAYIVCPLIEDSDSPMLSTERYIEALKTTVLADYPLGSLNGKLKAKEKDELMAKFQSNEIKILVSTTVIEVGVDVPNATVMLIENAEQFGLSQLHQLRGRVGRGEHKSYCILVSDNVGEENKKRLTTMKTTSDGFVIAEEDLKLRGPGDFFGFKQHGLPSLKLANLYDDIELLHHTREVARELLKTDPILQDESHKGLLRAVNDLFDKNGQENLN